MKDMKVFADADAIAAAACDYVLEAARQSIAERGVFNIVLSGGSTPRKLYELLARQTGVEWDKWQFFMGDERYVPQDDERSNQKLAHDTLLSKLSISDDQIHPAPVDQPSVEQAAEAYQAQIRQYFGGQAGVPAFDLILLGIGSDAHTASLFPGKPAVNETEKLVVSSPPGVLPPPVDRVTFTLPLINAARRVLFIIAGPDKTEALARVSHDLDGAPEQATTPAGKVRPGNGELLWFVDQAAAGE